MSACRRGSMTSLHAVSRAPALRSLTWQDQTSRSCRNQTIIVLMLEHRFPDSEIWISPGLDETGSEIQPEAVTLWLNPVLAGSHVSRPHGRKPALRQIARQSLINSGIRRVDRSSYSLPQPGNTMQASAMIDLRHIVSSKARACCSTTIANNSFHGHAPRYTSNGHDTTRFHRH
jgi:hypothetical protein